MRNLQKILKNKIQIVEKNCPLMRFNNENLETKMSFQTYAYLLVN